MTHDTSDRRRGRLPSALTRREALAAAALSTALPVLPRFARAAGPTGAPIVIGWLGPLSPPGGYAQGILMKDAAQMAVEEVNAGGGILGRPVQVVYADSRGQPAEGRAAAERLVQENKVVAAFGEFHSPVAIAEMEVFHRYGIPFMACDVWSDEITAKGYPEVFRNAPTVSLIDTAIGQWMVAAGFKNAALLAEKNDVGLAARTTIGAELKAKGIPFSAVDADPNATDFTAQILRYKSMSPPFDFFYTEFSEAGAYDLVRQAKELGFAPTAKCGMYNSGGSATDPTFWQNVGQSGVGLCTENVGLPRAAWNDKTRAFFAAFKKRFDAEPPGAVMESYDGAWLLFDAIHNAGNTDPKAIIHALETTKWVGVRGHTRSPPTRTRRGTTISSWPRRSPSFNIPSRSSRSMRRRSSGRAIWRRWSICTSRRLRVFDPLPPNPLPQGEGSKSAASDPPPLGEGARAEGTASPRMTSYLLVQAANGLVIGVIYALIAAGLTVIFSILKIVNFAHGEIYMMGGYFGFFVISLLNAPPLLAVIVAMALAFALSVLLERTLLTPLYNPATERKSDYGILVTFGISILLRNLAIIVFGPFPLRPPSFRPGVFVAGDLILSWDRVIAAGAGIAMLLALLVFLARSAWGQALGAVSQSRESAAIVGINDRLAYTLAFALGGALAGGAGALVGPIYALTPSMGLVPDTQAFAIVVLGGMGSVGGSIIAALLLGVSENLFVALFPDPTRGLSYAQAFSLVVLMLVLLVRPSGLFGRVHVAME